MVARVVVERVADCADANIKDVKNAKTVNVVLIKFIYLLVYISLNFKEADYAQSFCVARV